MGDNNSVINTVNSVEVISPGNAGSVEVVNAGNEEYYIKKEEYVRPPAGTPLARLPGVIEEKIRNAKQEVFPDLDYKIPATKYQSVYTTSDIHADLIVISRILFNAGLTTAIVNDDFENVFDIRWNNNARSTLLVIVGDIVDGGREGAGVPDPKGDIEILLHIFLFNLRLSAREYNSELRFLIGNHDFHTVIQGVDLTVGQLGRAPPPYGVGQKGAVEKTLIERGYYSAMDGFYNNYVHRTAKQFFGNRNNRRTCLLPFYEACPFITLTIGDEVIFVHASLHGGDTGEYSMVELLEDLQRRILEGSLSIISGPITDENRNDVSFLAYINEQNFNYGSPLWSRYYSISAEQTVCQRIAPFPYKLIIVGHCQTNAEYAYNTLPIRIRHSSEYTKTHCHILGGCVLLGCGDPASGPRIAFVDISMSRVFPTKGNREEILVLKHDDDRQGDRVYNTIYRINTLSIVKTPILVWQSAVKGGGRKTLKRRNKKRKQSRKKCRKM